MSNLTRWRLLTWTAFLLLHACAAKSVPPATTQTTTRQEPSREFVELMTTPATQPAIQRSPKYTEEGEKATLIYPCRFARTEVLAEAVTGLLTPEGSITASAPLNSLVVMDKKDTVRSVQNALAELDFPAAQLLIEARVVEIALDSDLEYELQHLLSIPTGTDTFLQGSDITLRTPGGSPTIDQGANPNLRIWQSNGKKLDSYLRLLITRGKAKVLSSPNLVVSPGSEASIITGQEVPVQSATVVSGGVNTTTQFKRVGIKLRVVLQQIAGDTARVEINPEVSTVTGYTQATQEGLANPIIAIRNVTSTLSVKDGEILTIGGLLQTEERQIIRGVPLLSDIPLLGLLFQSRRNTKQQTQLIFFLRAHILPEGQVDVTRVHQPGVGMDQLEKQMNLQLPAGNGQYPTNVGEMTNMPGKN